MGWKLEVRGRVRWTCNWRVIVRTFSAREREILCRTECIFYYYRIAFFRFNRSRGELAHNLILLLFRIGRKDATSCSRAATGGTGLYSTPELKFQFHALSISSWIVTNCGRV